MSSRLYVTCLATIAALGAASAVHAQFTPYLSMTAPTWEDETTIRLNGARIIGLGLSANDLVNARFRFRPSDASFYLLDANVVPDAGVVLRDQSFTSANVVPVGFTYSVTGTQYQSDLTERRFSTSTAAPFAATVALRVGHVISHRIASPTAGYRFELMDPTGTRVVGFDGTALTSGSLITFPYRAEMEGNYTLRITPLEPGTSMSFRFVTYNANNRELARIRNGTTISARFAVDIRDYFKGVVTLGAGQRLTLPKPSDSNVTLCIVDSLSRTKTCMVGLPLSFKATDAGDYYVFIFNENGWSSTYTGTAGITQEALQSTTDRLDSSALRFSPGKGLQ